MDTSSLPQWRLKNTRDGTEIEFHGEMIGASSSSDGQKPRWFEVHIFRTEAGKYVVAKIGRSRIYHRDSSDCVNDSMEKITAGKLFERSEDVRENHSRTVDRPFVEYSPCRSCSPGRLDDEEDLPDDAVLYVETDRVSTHVCETAEALVKALNTKDHAGVQYMTATARLAATQASEHDDAVRAAYMTQRVD